MSNTNRFLVRTTAGSGPAALNIGGARLALRSRPLFRSIGPAASRPPAAGQALGAAPAAQGANWHIVEPMFNVTDPVHPWDVCHEIVSQGMGIAGRGVADFAEPDLPQSWLCDTRADGLQLLQQACTADEQDPAFPQGARHDWYRDSDHGQFALLPADATGEGVRIAHLDTGYDPGHASRPAHLETQLARNFVDEGPADDAADDSSGLWNNRGHGTGTLSILAGAPVPGVGIPGVAFQASVVPVRVANRVELFYNSAIAQALDYVHELCRSPSSFVDVVSMSLGGLASQAWAEAVNALYDAGVFVVAAAGNNLGNLPTRNIVYPARFNRVVAACGVMADQHPYANLGLGKMAGNYGPASKMRTAVAAYTPNIPWARFGCARVDRFNGAGTSAATPQVAGAAALYIQAHREQLQRLPEPWMRVQAIRAALFGAAGQNNPDAVTLGRGIVKATSLLDQGVQPPDQLKRETPDSASFSLLRVLTGLGVAAQPNRQRMLELEALQLSQSAEIEALLPDPADVAQLSDAGRLAVLQALAQHPRASRSLKAALQPWLPSARGAPAVPVAQGPRVAPTPALPARPAYPKPTVRRLRIYTYDPSLGQGLDTASLNQTVAAVRWEEGLRPGPVGEYLEVVDVDPASGRSYPPVDLDDPRLLASEGLAPAEANPQFHQQMVYAVAMRTIEHFETALGRRALWAPHAEGGAGDEVERYVQRLRIYPHALRARNAYYSPQKKALLLGYFRGSATERSGDVQTVFTALSSDIVAHETTHALLDGLHRRFREATNDDVLAFHEAFADIVALFQHFSLQGALRNQIARHRGDLGHKSLLSGIALQFGKETGTHGALRDAIGKPADPADYLASSEPHDRGAVLVAAVFDAFMQIYERKAVEPIRLATGGSEVLAPGALQSDLADALARVAASVARHVLLMCIRALDYCPPVDLTFGDFLRAVITADRDLVPDDPHGYRVAFSSAFRARGIYPENVYTVSVDTLCWEPPPLPLAQLDTILRELSLHWDLQTDRLRAWTSSRHNAARFHRWLTDPHRVSDAELAGLGLQRSGNPNYTLALPDGSTRAMDLHGIEVHSVRPLRRVGPDGQLLSQLIVELTQSMHSKDGSGAVVRGGCTLVVDLDKTQVIYMVRKRAEQAARLARQQALWARASAPLLDPYTRAGAPSREPFKLLHGLH